MKYTFLFFLFLSLCIASCEEESYIPKPRGYFKIEYPPKNYTQFSKEGYPYQFEYPSYAQVIKDSLFFAEKVENPWWVNIQMPTLNATIYMSYKEINSKQTLLKLLDDSYKLSHYHAKKANYIKEDKQFHTANNVHGLYYDVGGNAASALQFFATDSMKHFIRGALYFNTTPNIDSLRPSADFLRKDVERIIETLKWTI